MLTVANKLFMEIFLFFQLQQQQQQVKSRRFIDWDTSRAPLGDSTHDNERE